MSKDEFENQIELLNRLYEDSKDCIISIGDPLSCDSDVLFDNLKRMRDLAAMALRSAIEMPK